MTSKEKAEELVIKYLKFTSKHEKLETAGLGAITLAKQCALIAVDEILDAIDWHEFETPNKELEYWEEVKQEIDKL